MCRGLEACADSRSPRSIVCVPAWRPQVFENYSKARTVFVNSIADLANKPANVDPLQSAGPPPTTITPTLTLVSC